MFYLRFIGERNHLYGNQRLWGSVGWGVFSVIAGLLVDKFSGNEVNKNYSVVFYMVLILIGLDFWFSLKIKVDDNTKFNFQFPNYLKSRTFKPNDLQI